MILPPRGRRHREGSRPDGEEGALEGIGEPGRCQFPRQTPQVAERKERSTGLSSPAGCAPQAPAGPWRDRAGCLSHGHILAAQLQECWRHRPPVRRLKLLVPATSTSAPAATARGAVSKLMPPSTSRSMGRSMVSMRSRSTPQLIQSAADEALAAEARIDGHHQDQVDVGHDMVQHRDRRCRIERNADFLVQRLDQLDAAVQVRSGFGVQGDDVGAGGGEFTDVGVTGEIIKCTSKGSTE